MTVNKFIKEFQEDPFFDLIMVDDLESITPTETGLIFKMKDGSIFRITVTKLKGGE